MEFSTSEDAEEYEWEGRRHALANLLRRRGAGQAAAIVAVSHYRAEWTRGDGWVVTLSVPAEFYDEARGEFGDVIRDGCIDVVGTDEFGGLTFRVKTPDYEREADWIDIIVRSLDKRWVQSERVTTSEAISM